MFDWSSSAWAALAAWLTLAVYAALLVYAVKQVGEARALRREQARPFVIVDFDVDWISYLTIENMGRTAAYDVRIAFEPPLASTLDPPWGWEESTALRTGIPLLPPGKRLRIEFDAINPRFESDLPMVYCASVTYSGPPGAPGPYADKSVLDLNIYQGSPPKEAGLPELVSAVKDLHTALKAWTYSIDGLRVYSIDARKHEQDRLAQRAQRRERRPTTPQEKPEQEQGS